MKIESWTEDKTARLLLAWAQYVKEKNYDELTLTEAQKLEVMGMAAINVGFEDGYRAGYKKAQQDLFNVII